MRHISQVIAIAICVIGLTSIATAQDNTALPTDWTTETPIAWLNAQATPDLAPQAPAVNEPPAEGSDAYAIALDALVSVILGVVNTTGGAVVVGLGIWKFAPIVLAIAEFLTKLTPRTDDDMAVARLRTELERAGIIPITPTVTPLKEMSVSSTFGRVGEVISDPPYTVTTTAFTSDRTSTTILPGSEG